MTKPESCWRGSCPRTSSVSMMRTSPAMKRQLSPGSCSSGPLELFTISGFDPSPHRNMCHCARFRWVLHCNSEPCCPGGSGCPSLGSGALPCFTCPHKCVWYGFRRRLRAPVPFSTTWLLHLLLKAETAPLRTKHAGSSGR